MHGTPSANLEGEMQTLVYRVVWPHIGNTGISGPSQVFCCAGEPLCRVRLYYYVGELAPKTPAKDSGHCRCLLISLHTPGEQNLSRNTCHGQRLLPEVGALSFVSLRETNIVSHDRRWIGSVHCLATSSPLPVVFLCLFFMHEMIHIEEYGLKGT